MEPGPDLIVAIDFGTHRSAIVFLVDGHLTYEYTNWIGSPNPDSAKGATWLWFVDEKATNIGYQLEKDTPKDSVIIIEKEFKMHLNEAKTKNGNSVMTCVSEYLRILVAKGDVTLKKQTGKSISSFKNVRWCLTIPAIWQLEDKQKMAEAMVRAGILKGPAKDALLFQDLVLALEPEAAATYFLEYAKTNSLELKNKTVLVVDAGGGTIDLTLHSAVENQDGTFKWKEIIPGKGNQYGGNSINNQVYRHIIKTVGEENWKKFQEKTSHWKNLQKDVEEKKCTVSDISNRSGIRLPPILSNMIKASQLKDRVQVKGDDDDGYELVLDWSLYFKDSLEDTAAKVNEMITEAQKHCTVNYVFLVGGFANSPILQKCIEDAVKGRVQKVFLPKNPEIAIAYGARMFGLSPNIIGERKLRETWGLAVNERFDPVHHKGLTNLWENPKTGDKWVTRVFRPFTKQGEAHTFDSIVPVELETLYPGQKYIDLAFYACDVNIPTYIDADQKTKQRGRLVVKLSSTKGNKVRVNIEMGKTTPVATAEMLNEPTAPKMKAELDGSLFQMKWNVIFVIDRSGSMGSDDPKPSGGSAFNRSHPNRLGAVFEAITGFMKKRLEIARPFRGAIKGQNEKGEDTYSFVTFDDSAEVKGTNLTLNNESDIFDVVKDIVPGAGTNYTTALSCIIRNSLISKDNDPAHPTQRHEIIFLSDGEDGGRKDDCLNCIRTLVTSAEFVTLHTIHLGSDRNAALLQTMAKEGGGIFCEVGSNQEDLLLAFQLLAAKPV